MASALLSSRSNSGPSAATPTHWAEAANRNKTITICLVLGLIFTARTTFFRPFQEKVDAAFDIGVAIRAEMQLRNVPEAQARGQFVPKEPRRMLQRRHGCLQFPIGAAQRDFYRSMFTVRVNVNNHHFHRQ